MHISNILKITVSFKVWFLELRESVRSSRRWVEVGGPLSSNQFHKNIKTFAPFAAVFIFAWMVQK